MEKIRVILVDDHQIVRDGLKSILEQFDDIEVIGEAHDAKSLYFCLLNSIPNIILMDISLPDKSGIDITAELSSKHPDIGIIMLSMYISEEFILNAFKAGAKGYLPKNASKDELASAIRDIANGEEFYNEQITKILAKSTIRKSTIEDASSSALSKREIEILTLYSKGYSNKEIADSLFISNRTVESHKNHIMQKLNLKSQVDMVKFAIKNNLIDL